MQQEKGFKQFDFIPTTFVLPQEYYQFKCNCVSYLTLYLIFNINI